MLNHVRPDVAVTTLMKGLAKGDYHIMVHRSFWDMIMDMITVSCYGVSQRANPFIDMLVATTSVGIGYVYKKYIDIKTAYAPEFNLKMKKHSS